MIQLRYYQKEAVEAVYEHLRTRDDNPCLVLPTGAGKGFIIARICVDAAARWGGRALVLAHVKELLEQTAENLRTLAPDLDVGVYCAGLNQRDTDHDVIVASIQSVYRRADQLGPFDLILIDEGHRIPPDGEGRYQTFFSDATAINPHIRLIGLTATPYRMKTGMICEPDHLLNKVCYEIGVKELIADGYLCPLKTKAGSEKVDTSGLHVRAGEFIGSETQELMDTEELVRHACEEIIEHTAGCGATGCRSSASAKRPAGAADRHSCLIFASGVDHGKHIARLLRNDHQVECETVFGETPSDEREAVLERFRAGTLPYLVNMDVLTTGFDAPNIDCIALVRPTNSPGLFYQMVGRGFRIDESKEDCLVLDFGGNVLRHGPVDDIRVEKEERGDGEAPAKECPECRALIAAGYRVCPECGYEFPPPEKSKHASRATTASILSGEVTVDEHTVQGVSYGVHRKRGAPEGHPPTLRVEYQTGWSTWQSEFICLEHTGWARTKAEDWWAQRTGWPVPDTVEEAVEIAQKGGLCETYAITVRSVAGEKYDSVAGYKLGPKPAPYCDSDGFVLNDEEIPF